MAAPFTLQELLTERAADRPDQIAARMGDRRLTHRELYRDAIAWAHLFRAKSSAGSRPRVAVLMKNNLEFLTAYGGVAFSGGTLFGLNTGLGGDVLRRVIDASGAEILIVDDANHASVVELVGSLERVRAVLRVGDGGNVHSELARVASSLGERFDHPPEIDGVDATSPFCVIYTSGTTGLPKGVVNSHGKLRGIGIAVSMRAGLRASDVGYVSMPLFHSNALFLNWIPAMQVGASVCLRDKFSASGFFDDVVRYGATYWNYVGQPVHYVLEALLAAAGGDVSRVLSEVRDHPDNHLRLAIGTGASGSERRRFVEWLGLEHVYETYGSTEAEINSWCMPGDPIDSVGRVDDDAVVVVGEGGRECPSLEIDERGAYVNAARAVGEIVRRGTMGLFQGYHGMPDASAKKVEGGLYRSGDLGAIRVTNGQRHLYFFGRTDDWIRKDGENFSAQSVVEMCESFPVVDRAAAFGAPHPVSDEWVMVALSLKPGEHFDPEAFFEHCRGEVASGKDAKWMPDFVRVVDAFEWTETLKIKVRVLKGVFYHPEHASRVFFRQRGDATFRQFGRADFERLRSEFVKSGREHLLEPRP